MGQLSNQRRSHAIQTNVSIPHVDAVKRLNAMLSRLDHSDIDALRHRASVRPVTHAIMSHRGIFNKTHHLSHARERERERERVFIQDPCTSLYCTVRGGLEGPAQRSLEFIGSGTSVVGRCQLPRCHARHSTLNMHSSCCRFVFAHLVCVASRCC